MSAQFDTATAGLRKNRDELLAEKKTGEGKEPVTHENFDEWLAGLDARIAKIKADGANLTGKPAAQPTTQVREHTITREQARSGQAYREAKEAAEKAGVPLRIVDENTPSQDRRGSPVKYVKDADAGVLYVNADMIRRYGQARCREIAAEQGASSMRAFRSVDDLPNGVAAAHAQAVADRSNLLGGE